MIKFVHRKHAERTRGTAKIIITYTAFEVILGLLLLFTNISAMILIYHFVINPYSSQTYYSVYPGAMHTNLPPTLR